MTKPTVTAIKTKLFIGTAVIQKELGLIKAASAKLDQRIQVAGLSVLAHIDEHHNITLFNELLDSMGKGHRKTAMVEWALKSGTISKNEVDGKLDKEQPYKWDKTKTLNLAQAEETPWFNFKPENLDDTFDFAKMLGALLSKAAKQHSKDPTKLINAELLDQVKALVPAK
jgi:hypothetical protein